MNAPAKGLSMNEFIRAHAEEVMGVIEGWDRVMVRGSLLRLSYVERLSSYLYLRRILPKEFGSFCQRTTYRAGEAAQRCPLFHPLQSLNSLACPYLAISLSALNART